VGISIIPVNPPLEGYMKGSSSARAGVQEVYNQRKELKKKSNRKDL
jgi:hypothetical protein